MTASDERMARKLLEAGVITGAASQAALQVCADDDEVGVIGALANAGEGSEAELTRKLADVLGVSLVTAAFDVELDTIQLLPADIRASEEVVPLMRSGASLSIAMVDPTDIDAVEQVKFITGYMVAPALISRSDFRLLHAKACEAEEQSVYGGLTFDDLLDEAFGEEGGESSAHTEETFSSRVLDGDAEMQHRGSGTGGDGDPSITKLVNLMLVQMIKERPPVARLITADDRVVLSHRVGDGWVEVVRPPLRIGPALLWRLKELVDLEAGPIRTTREGTVVLQIGNGKTQLFRITFEPIEKGIAILFDIPLGEALGSEPFNHPLYVAALEASGRAVEPEAKLRKLAEAEGYAREAADASAVAKTRWMAGHALVDAGRLKEARDWYLRAHDHLATAQTDGMSRVALLRIIAHTCGYEEDYEQEASYATEALALAQAFAPAARFEAALCLDSQAEALAIMGEYATSRGVRDEEIAIHRELSGEPTLSEGVAFIHRAGAYADAEVLRAVEDARRGLELVELLLPGPPAEPHHVVARLRLADRLRRAGQAEEAFDVARAAKARTAKLSVPIRWWTDPSEILSLLFAERGSMEAAAAAFAQWEARTEEEPLALRPRHRLQFVRARLAELSGETSAARLGYADVGRGRYEEEAAERLEALEDGR